MKNLTKTTKNGWVIVVENDDTPIQMQYDDKKNHSSIFLWAYHPNITEYKPLSRDSKLTTYRSNGYRNKEGLKFNTSYMWMAIETLQNRLENITIA